jgi:predicted phosphodiesterase
VRYGIVSDIHGNLSALAAVLRRLEALDVAMVLCVGDIVGYGAQPNECIERLVEIGAVSVAGNHDLFAVDRLPARLPPFVKDSARWTAQALGADARDYLTGLPLRASAAGVTVAHGSLDDPQEYVVQGGQAEAQLGRLSEVHPGADLLILGHTHRPMVYAGGRMVTPPAGPFLLPPARPILLNPGSVGQSRQIEFPPRARALLVDWPEGIVQFLTIRYDTGTARRTLRAQGLPASGMHLWPGRVVGRLRTTRARRPPVGIKRTNWRIR